MDGGGGEDDDCDDDCGGGDVCWTEVGPASMIVGNLVAGKRIAQACGRDVAQLEDNDQARKVQIMPPHLSPFTWTHRDM